MGLNSKATFRSITKREPCDEVELGDVITDLMLWGKRKKIPVDLALEQAVRHFEHESDDYIECALCDKLVRFKDSYSPGDEAICAACDTKVTGRVHKGK
jgi:hypothetical protein